MAKTKDTGAKAPRASKKTAGAANKVTKTPKTPRAPRTPKPSKKDEDGYATRNSGFYRTISDTLENGILNANDGPTVGHFAAVLAAMPNQSEDDFSPELKKTWKKFCLRRPESAQLLRRSAAEIRALNKKGDMLSLNVKVFDSDKISPFLLCIADFVSTKKKGTVTCTPMKVTKVKAEVQAPEGVDLADPHGFMDELLSRYLNGRPLMVVEQLDQVRQLAIAMAEGDTAGAAAILNLELDTPLSDDEVDGPNVSTPASTAEKHGSGKKGRSKKATKKTPKKEKAEKPIPTFGPTKDEVMEQLDQRDAAAEMSDVSSRCTTPGSTYTDAPEQHREATIPVDPKHYEPEPPTPAASPEVLDNGDADDA